MIALVGYTGFVGSNVLESSSGRIDALYNSKNIFESYETCPDVLIYSGLRAEKYLANKSPDKDMELIEIAKNNISRIKPRKLVLISTIDVFKKPVDVDENSPVDTNGQNAYGLNRFKLEQWVRVNYPDALIIRLPGLFGKNIKKNFIYDFINIIPSMLKESKFEELSAANPELKSFYVKQDNGFYKVVVQDNDKDHLRSIFREIGFSALNFTDSRSVFQFYDLSRLWDDINICLSEELTLFHPATEPVRASEIYEYLTGSVFYNELESPPAYYDYKTIHSLMFGGKDGYLYRKEKVLEEIKRFVEDYGSIHL